MNTSDEDSLFGRATKEEDEPILVMEKKESDSGYKAIVDDLEVQKLKMKEREEQRKDDRYFNAVKIFVGCLVFLGIVYGIDVGVNGILNGEISSITNGVVEIIKTLLFTLSGYLFARNENK